MHSVYYITIVEALVRYLHAATGLPVNSTWLRSIKAVNFETWPGLTYSNASKYCPHDVETLKGHMVQSPQGVCSTKKKMVRLLELKTDPKIQERALFHLPSKLKGYIFGTNPSVKSIPMTVDGFLFVQEAEISI